MPRIFMVFRSVVVLGAVGDCIGACAGVTREDLERSRID